MVGTSRRSARRRTSCSPCWPTSCVAPCWPSAWPWTCFAATATRTLPSAQVQGVVERQTDHMGCLIDKLLNFSRIRQGKAKLRKQQLDLAHVVNAAVDTVQSSIEGQGHALEITLAPVPMPLDADPILLEQVLTNLLMNAAKYTDRGGRIWLTARPEGNNLVIRVRDNGIGIEADALQQVFDLFRQSPRTAEQAAGGLGLGLALVRQIVEMHGGSVSAASDGPGKGSEFVVRLPQAPLMHLVNRE